MDYENLIDGLAFLRSHASSDYSRNMLKEAALAIRQLQADEKEAIRQMLRSEVRADALQQNAESQKQTFQAMAKKTDALAACLQELRDTTPITAQRKLIDEAFRQHAPDNSQKD